MQKLCIFILVDVYIRMCTYVSHTLLRTLCEGALAHMADRKIAYAVITKGGRIGVITNFNLLMEDIWLLQPTTFTTTPRFSMLLYVLYSIVMQLMT